MSRNSSKRLCCGEVTDSKNKKQKSSQNQDIRFKHGNYNRYYGYRNPGNDMDKRIPLLKKEWFENKRCLDIGCNVGHLTLWIAKHFKPLLMKGVDIDTDLIKAAKSNVVHYLDEDNITLSASTQSSLKSDCEQILQQDNDQMKKRNNEIEKENTSSEVAPCNDEDIAAKDKDSKDHLSSKHVVNSNCHEFPKNVTFVLENYVPASLSILKYVKPLYDVILCLSVTKWVQLNNGDEGLKLMFQKIYQQLHEGGLLVLEPQHYDSYKRRKNLSPQICKNYNAICLKPDQYPDYLLSASVGFISCEKLNTSVHDKPGFQRPIYLFRKGVSQP